MEINQIIPIILWLLAIILILTNYIVIKKPYNYLTILFIIPAIIVETPLVNSLNKSLETILVPLYFVLALILLICYAKSEKK